jgi:uncharacterized protein
MTASSLRNVAEAHLEVARTCNLHCRYCYEARENGTPALMPLLTALDYVELVIGSTGCSALDLTLHGGEPMLQSATWVANVAEHATRVAALAGKRVHFSMQSNCTMLDDDMFEVLGQYRIRVGTSLDGDPSSNEATRGKSDTVVASIDRLRAEGIFGGLICVMHGGNARSMRQTLEYFDTLGVRNVLVTVCRCVGRGVALDPMDSETILAGYLSILDYLSHTRGARLVESMLADKLARFLDPPTRQTYDREIVCSHPICGGGITTLYCDTSGRLYPCGLAVSREDLVLGSIVDPDEDRHRSVVESMYSSRLERGRCHQCEASSICSFGCTALDTSDPCTAAAECSATQALYRVLLERDRDEICTIAASQEAGKQ